MMQMVVEMYPRALRDWKLEIWYWRHLLSDQSGGTKGLALSSSQPCAEITPSRRRAVNLRQTVWRTRAKPLWRDALGYRIRRLDCGEPQITAEGSPGGAAAGH